MQNIVYRVIKNEEVAQFYLKRWEFQIEEHKTVSSLTAQDFVSQCLEWHKSENFNKAYTNFAAFKDKEMVSIASVNKIFMMPKPHKVKDYYGYLTNVYTVPEFRNQGIGKQLLEMIKIWALEEDLELLMVWLSEASISFYKRLGFQEENQSFILKLREYL